MCVKGYFQISGSFSDFLLTHVNLCLMFEVMKIFNTIAWNRQEEGLTQEQVAELVGMHWRSLQDYEGGKRYPPLDRCRQIATALKCSVADLWPVEE